MSDQVRGSSLPGHCSPPRGVSSLATPRPGFSSWPQPSAGRLVAEKGLSPGLAVGPASDREGHDQGRIRAMVIAADTLYRVLLEHVRRERGGQAGG